MYFFDVYVLLYRLLDSFHKASERIKRQIFLTPFPFPNQSPSWPHFEEMTPNSKSSAQFCLWIFRSVCYTLSSFSGTWISTCLQCNSKSFACKTSFPHGAPSSSGLTPSLSQLPRLGARVLLHQNGGLLMEFLVTSPLHIPPELQTWSFISFAINSKLFSLTFKALHKLILSCHSWLPHEKSSTNIPRSHCSFHSLNTPEPSGSILGLTILHLLPVSLWFLSPVPGLLRALGLKLL